MGPCSWKSSTAKILDVLGGYLIALLEDHKRADLFPIFFAGDPDYLHVLNTLHPVNELLDFARRYVLAAPDYQVLESPRYGHVTILGRDAGLLQNIISFLSGWD